MAKRSKREARLRRQRRVRRRVVGTSERPRLCVFRSAKHIYAQVIDDQNGSTLVSASSLTVKSDDGAKVGVAKAVGQAVAAAAKKAGINQVIFDRNGFLYHGRIAAVAEGARDGGLEF